MPFDYGSLKEDRVEASDFEKAVREGDIDFIAYAANVLHYDEDEYFDMDRFPDGGHPLSLACENGFLDVAKELINWGADIHEWDSENPTPLILAAQNGHSHVISWLVEHGVNIDHIHEEIDHYGDWEWAGSALSEAIRNCHYDIAEYLMDHGADLDSLMVVTYPNTDSLHGPSMFRESCPILELLRPNSLYLFFKAMNLDSFNSVSEETRSRILGKYIVKGLTERTNTLLLQCHNVINRPIDDGENPDEWYPIEVAARCKNEHMLHLLLENGADILSMNEGGDFIFDSVASWWPEKMKDIIETIARQMHEKNRKENMVPLPHSDLGDHR